MVMMVSGISIAVYIITLIGLRKRIVEQQFVMSIIFLVSLTVVGELDVMLPIYFLFSLIPFIKRIRRLSVFSFLMMVYTAIYLLYGLIAQNPTRSIATYLAKVWQFIIFFIVCDADIEVKEGKWGRLLWIALVVESIIGLYLMRTQTKIDALSGLVRLGSNAQPITGNISTIVLSIVIYLYFANRGNRKFTRHMLWICVGYLVWIVLSGTRGYTLEFVAALFLIAYDYFTNKEIGETSQRSRITIAFALFAVGMIIVVVVPGVLERLSALLRIRASVGIRTYENEAVKEFFRNSPLHVEMFGIGFGGTASNYSAMAEALNRQFSLGMWNKNYYMTNSGALFHNLYSNILMNMGIVGIVTVIILFIQMWKRITNSCNSHILERKCMHLFLISFFLMNYYRWSAICGIGEMIILALMLKKIEQDDMSSDRNEMLIRE